MFKHTATGYTAESGFASASGPNGAAIDRLEAALDVMHASKVLFLGSYSMLGAVERRAGGQGVVQFAARHSQGGQVAVKVRTPFFTTTNRVHLLLSEVAQQQTLRKLDSR